MTRSNPRLVVSCDRGTAEVLAWGGSTGYFDKARTGAIDYTSVSRSPGSTLKPFLVAHALDRGVITPSTILDDIERGPGGIGNADDAFLGPMLPRSALANSRNVPAAQLVARLGVDETYGYLRELRLHDGREPARRTAWDSRLAACQRRSSASCARIPRLRATAGWSSCAGGSTIRSSRDASCRKKPRAW